MSKLRGRVMRWEAPSNKGDAARYWGHSGEFVLVVGDSVELEIRNAVGGVILRESKAISLKAIEEFLGEDVEVEGTFEQGQIIEEEASFSEEASEEVGAVQKPVSSAPMQMMQTLMTPSQLDENGKVHYRPAPRYKGAGFVARSIERAPMEGRP